MYDRLKGEIAKRKQIDRLSYGDLAKKTGYEPQTIAAFMCGARNSAAVAEALAKALGLEDTNDE